MAGAADDRGPGVFGRLLHFGHPFAVLHVCLSWAEADGCYRPSYRQVCVPCAAILIWSPVSSQYRTGALSRTGRTFSLLLMLVALPFFSLCPSLREGREYKRKQLLEAALGLPMLVAITLALSTMLLFALPFYYSS